MTELFDTTKVQVLSKYLSLHLSILQTRKEALYDLFDCMHVIRDKVHRLHGSVGEESIVTKQCFNRWFKSFTLNTNL